MVESLHEPKADSLSCPVLFDTLEYAKRLQELGVEPENAKAQSQLLVNVIAESVPTKQEMREQIILVETRLEIKIVALDARVQNLHQGMQAEFKAVRQEMQAEFKAVRQEMQAEFKLVRQEAQQNMIVLDTKIQESIAKLKVEMTRWYIVTSIGICGLMLSIAGYLSFLIKH